MKTENLYTYFGKDSNNNLIATPLNSMILGGVAGSGKSSIIRNLLLDMVARYTDSNLKIFFCDMKGYELNLWKKYVPEGNEIAVLEDTMYFSTDPMRRLVKLFSTLEQAVMVAKRRCVQVEKFGRYTWMNEDANPFDSNQYSMVIIDDFTEIPYGDSICHPYTREYFFYLIKKIVRYSDVSGIYVFLASQPNPDYIPSDLLKSFPVRLATRLPEDRSILYVDTEKPSHEEIKYGMLYVKSEGVQVIRLTTNYHDDSFVERFVRLYSRPKF